MCHEGDVEALDRERLDTFLKSGRCTPHDPGTEVDYVRGVVDDNRRGGAGPLRISARSPRAEEHNLRPV